MAPLAAGLGRHVLVEGSDVLVFHVHHFLELFHVDFLDILLARGPLAGLQALDAAHDFHHALQQQHEA